MKREDILRNELAKQFYNMDVEDLFIAYKVMNGLLNLGMDEYSEKDSKNFQKWLNENVEYEPIDYDAYKEILVKFISEHECSPAELEKILLQGSKKTGPKLSSAKIGQAVCDTLSYKEFEELKNYIDNNKHDKLYDFIEKRVKALFPETTKGMITRVMFKIVMSVKR